MSEIFDSLSFSEEDAEAVLDEFEAEKSLNGQICACGHTIKQHTFSSVVNKTMCKSGKQLCTCAYVNPVLRVSNSRFFMRKSTGHGPRHALTLGILSVIKENRLREEYVPAKDEKKLKKQEITMEWINNPISCEKCQAIDKKLSPILLTTNRVRFDMDISDTDRLVTALLCEECAG
jgi:hypothetical protein